MKSILLLLSAIVFFFTGKAQITADSMHIFYGMTQSAPENPLMEYIEHLETSGAKKQLIKKDEFEKIQDSFAKVKPKKYKGGKHKGTVYFVVVYSGGEKQFGAFDSSPEAGQFINLSTKKIWTIEDKGMIDKLYYVLLQIH